MIKARLLVVDDEELIIHLFVRRLGQLSYKVYSASSGVEALKILQCEEIDVLITDFQLPGMDGSEIIRQAIKIQPIIQSIVITGYSDIKTVINAMGAGAFNYLQKPVDFAELDIAIEKGLEKRKLIEDVQNKQRQLEKYRNQLEDLVEKRTLAVTEANQKLKKEIEERKWLENSLREAKLIAENANRAKSKFLANMSHEIRTPMTSAIGLLNLVLDTKLLPKQKAYLEMARVSTVIMHNLLSDILDFSKIEAGRLTLESISFNPEKIIKSVIDLQHFHAKENSTKLVITVADDVPNSVVGDPNRLRQIILNLVSNAIKFTQYGEVSIACKRAPDESFDEHISEETVPLHFIVQDSGIGIDKKKIELIFEAFAQVDSSTTRKFGGVGLGLNICSKLVDMMGGRIWVKSEPGQGSTFHFTSRFGAELVRSDRKEAETKTIPSTVPESHGEETATVLVVEDDMTNQWVIQEILEKEGYIVINASDGVTALKELDNQFFNLVLLDLKMPEMNGYEVVHQIRKREKAATSGGMKPLPIIALTGFAGKDEKQKCLDAGMDDFLAKPFSIDQLISITQKYTRGRSTEHTPNKRLHRRTVPDTSILQGEIFNETAALKRASGDQKLMTERIRVFLQKVPQGIEVLRKDAVSDGNTLLLEQEVQSMKDKAMEIGATSFADELFSLLMQLRRKQHITNASNKMDSLETEFDHFVKEIQIRRL